MKKLILSLMILTAVACVREETVVEESYPDGMPKKECVYKGRGEDREIIKETKYYPNRKVEMSGTYKNAKRDGYWVSFYENGNKWSEGNYRDGMAEGRRTTYFESGKVRYTGEYLNNRRVGKWQFYDEAGNLLKEVDFTTPRADTTLPGPRP